MAVHTKRRVLAARLVALLADAVQLGFLPLFAGGAPEGFDAVLDLLVGGTMIALLGWHWAFLPAFAAEALPGIDLAPTWTLAVLLVTRKGAAEPIEAVRVDTPPPSPPSPPSPPPPPLPPALPR